MLCCTDSRVCVQGFLFIEELFEVPPGERDGGFEPGERGGWVHGKVYHQATRS